MNRNWLEWLLIGLFALWVYWFPYDWWNRYSKGSQAQAMVEWAAFNGELPMGGELSGGASSLPIRAQMAKADEAPKPKDFGSTSKNIAQPALDEIKKCFIEGPVTTLTAAPGDLGYLSTQIIDQIGPITENVLLEKRAILNLPDGRTRTLVYEWLSPDEGSDVYWHETDGEGFPRPVDLPSWAGHDIETYNKLKLSVPSVASSSESRLLMLGRQIQLALEKTDGVIQNLTLRDTGHLTKCRLDPVRTFVCDCLN